MCAKESKSFDGASATPEGMLYKGVICQPVVEKCEGCERQGAFEGQNYCFNYQLPSSKWAMGRCNLATHVKAATQAAAKVNPLKASKRAAGGKGGGGAKGGGKKK